MTANLQQLSEFVDVFSDGMLASDVAQRFTCREAEALAGALTALGAAEAANTWLAQHALHDDPEERAAHTIETAEVDE